MGRIVGGVCSCFEIDDEVREREVASETEKGLGIIWQEEKEGGGYFGSPKEKVSRRAQTELAPYADSDERFDSTKGV